MQRLADTMRTRLTHDACRDAVIQGRKGNIHADGTGYSVAVLCREPKQLDRALTKLPPHVVGQRGDYEAVVHINAPLGKRDADRLARMLEIKQKKTVVSEKVLAALAKGREALRSSKKALDGEALDSQKT